MKKLIIFLLILMSCEEFGIEYEAVFHEYGFYGINILNEKTTEVNPNEDYSMAVDIFNGNLYIELTNELPDSGGWYYSLNSKSGWLIGAYSDSTQRCKASLNSDMLIMFFGTGLMSIEYYWNGDLLTKKKINWKTIQKATS